jgi:uncharacterized RDD family membrane protein YckC
VSGLFLGLLLTIALGERHRETTSDATGVGVSYTSTGDSKVFFLWALLTLGYFIVFEALAGATLGKLLLNLRVRCEDGSRIGLGLVAAVSIWGNRKRRGLGDRAAGTIVAFK